MRNQKTTSVLTVGLVAALAVPALAADGDKVKAPAPTVVESMPLSEYRAGMEKETREYLENSKEHPAIRLPFQHYRPRLDPTLKLKDGVAKMRAEVVQIVDGMVIYIPEGSVDRTRYPRIEQVPKNALKRATFAPGIETLARRKVGQTITLHLQNDPKGFAFVTNVTR